MGERPRYKDYVGDRNHTIYVEPGIWKEFDRRLAEVNERRKAQAGANGGKPRDLSYSDQIQVLIELWNKDPQAFAGPNYFDMSAPLSKEEFAREIATSAAEQLATNEDWLVKAVLAAQLYRDGMSIFGERLEHYKNEKQTLAKRFVFWLVKRIIHFLREKREVVLFVDSGTSTYWAIRVLEVALADAVQRETDISFDGLSIVTNNIPGVDSYMSYSWRRRFERVGEKKEVGLSDCVTCRMLGGKVLTPYAAVTGKETTGALEALAKTSAKMIALVVGSWIRIDSGPGKYPTPIPLASGDGQIDLKQAAMKFGEVYVLSPLGKVFVNKTFEDIDDAFQKKNYGEVERASVDPTKVRLVTTLRPEKEQRLLSRHSLAVKTIFDAKVDTDYGALVGRPIEELPTLAFQYAPPLANELETECPHPETRTPEFLRNFYSVQL